MGRATKVCVHCSAIVFHDPRYSRRYWERQKYCSQKCAGAAHSAVMAIKRKPKSIAFFEQVTITPGCWLWTGLKDKDGYGLFPYARQMLRAPRVALELDGRPVPTGRYACHHCDNPGCVNPAHLYPGTPTENMADARLRRRLAVGGRRSRKLKESDVLAIRQASGTHESIAAEYGIARATVSLIRERKTWRHLP